jgi:hypothetical protein
VLSYHHPDVSDFDITLHGDYFAEAQPRLWQHFFSRICWIDHQWVLCHAPFVFSRKVGR